MKDQNNWTVDAQTGRANSSAKFKELTGVVSDIILNSAHDLIHGRAETVAGLIMAKLAHSHGVTPRLAWINVRDRLPEPGIEVLAITKSNGRRVVTYDADAAAVGSRHCWRRDEGKRWSSAHGDYVYHATCFEVTHWMPLPTLPTAEPAASEPA